MSLRRPIYNEGAMIAVEDDQTTGDAFAAADDRVTELLLMPGTVTGPDGTGTNTKRVCPLSDNGSVTPRLLLVPSTTNGKVRLRPAWFGAGNVKSGTSSAPLLKLAHTQYVTVDSAAIPANATGSPKYHGVYATIARSVTERVARLTRNSDDIESTQTMDLGDATSLSLSLTAQVVSRADALAALPADSTSTWTFFIGYLTIANGYALNDAIGQDSGSSSYIDQAWDSGGIPAQRLAVARAATFYDSGDSTVPPTLLTRRHGQMETVYCGFIHKTNPQTKTLDSSMDWRHRVVRVTLIMPDGGTPGANPPEAALGQGYQFPLPGNRYTDMGAGFTGSGGVGNYFFTRIYATFGSGGLDITIKFYADNTTGPLMLSISGDSPHNAGGDHWFAIFEVFPQHILSP